MKTPAEAAAEYCDRESLPWNKHDDWRGDYFDAFLAGHAHALESEAVTALEITLLAVKENMAMCGHTQSNSLMFREINTALAAFERSKSAVASDPQDLEHEKAKEK